MAAFSLGSQLSVSPKKAAEPIANPFETAAVVLKNFDDGTAN